MMDFLATQKKKKKKKNQEPSNLTRTDCQARYNMPPAITLAKSAEVLRQPWLE
jgi:hypothetical protein